MIGGNHLRKKFKKFLSMNYTRKKMEWFSSELTKTVEEALYEKEIWSRYCPSMEGKPYHHY